MTKALVDGDLVAYRCAASCENEELEVAYERMEGLLDTILTDTDATFYSVYLSGSTNFRYRVYPEYKANRKEEKPKWLDQCKQYLVEKHRAITSVDCEADDLMGIEQSIGEGSIICSLDKDMLQVPGRHYSWRIEGGIQEKRWVKEAIHRTVTPIEGDRQFYWQMLVGDSSDNIKGVQGVGKVKATAMLSNVDDSEEMFRIVRDAYGFDEIMLMNGQVLHIQRKAGELWTLPYETKDHI